MALAYTVANVGETETLIVDPAGTAHLVSEVSVAKNTTATRNTRRGENACRRFSTSLDPYDFPSALSLRASILISAIVRQF